MKLVKYRRVADKKRSYFELVLDRTPFYAESGGQVGDKGWLRNNAQTINIFDTRKENDLVIHLAAEEPENEEINYLARVDMENRRLTENNHSATHLMHHALRKVLGEHVEQKGSLVDADHLRFDFSHFQKMTEEEISEVEHLVNRMIRQNTHIDEHRNIPMQDAMDMGALAFFGEKYGEQVRVIKFGDSVELCGGTHVPATGQIGFFKIVSESAIAAGVRRIEAVTADAAEAYVGEQLKTASEIRQLLKNPKDPVKGILALIEENKRLQKANDTLNRKISESLLNELLQNAKVVKGVGIIAAKVDVDTAIVKNMVFSLLKKGDNLMVVLGNEADGKAYITVGLSDELIKKQGLDAAKIIRELAPEIKGGGGGQAHFATAGGKDPSGIASALAKAQELL